MCASELSSSEDPSRCKQPLRTRRADSSRRVRPSGTSRKGSERSPSRALEVSEGRGDDDQCAWGGAGKKDPQSRRARRRRTAPAGYDVPGLVIEVRAEGGVRAGPQSDEAVSVSPDADQVQMHFQAAFRHRRLLRYLVAVTHVVAPRLRFHSGILDNRERDTNASEKVQGRTCSTL